MIKSKPESITHTKKVSFSDSVGGRGPKGPPSQKKGPPTQKKGPPTTKKKISVQKDPVDRKRMCRKVRSVIRQKVPTYWIFVGESGSGKTILAQEMFARYFQNVFTQLVIVSDTFHTKTRGSWESFYEENGLFENKFVAVIDKLEDIKEYRDAAKKVREDTGSIRKSYTGEEFNKARFYDPSLLVPFSQYKKPPQTLWIFDDFLGSIKLKTKDHKSTTTRSFRSIINGVIDEMVINARHRACSAFVLCQERVGIPPTCLLYTSPSPRDRTRSRMPSSA